jgi:hypothetical protein
VYLEHREGLGRCAALCHYFEQYRNLSQIGARYGGFFCDWPLASLLRYGFHFGALLV